MELLDIGYGLKIGLKTPDAWQIWAKNGHFDLVETADFFRVVTLLERPYTDAEFLLNDYANRSNTSLRFPLWKVVGAGLASQSDQWASLALNWFSNLEQTEKAMLVDYLAGVSRSKWASQKSRQLAERYLKQLQKQASESKG